MESGGKVHGFVGVRGVQGYALSVFEMEVSEIEEEVALHVRRGQENLAELYRPARLGVCGDALESAEEAAIAHATGDDVHLVGSDFAAKCTTKSVMAGSLVSMLASSAG